MAKGPPVDRDAMGSSVTPQPVSGDPGSRLALVPQGTRVAG